MKKAIASSLCSAFVIPGLGQIINADLKKGIALLCTVFFLFIIGIIRLVRLVNDVFRSGGVAPSSTEVLHRLKAEDFSLLYGITAAFALLWLYSVVDAFLKGRKMDQMAAENHEA